MYFLQRLGFSKYEGIMGLGVLAIAVLVILPPLRSGLIPERNMRAVVGAENIARAVLDYHTDKGMWPDTEQGEMDLSVFASAEYAVAGTNSSQNMFGAMFAGGVDKTVEKPQTTRYLPEIPMDPWNRPYLALLVDGGDRLPVSSGEISRLSASQLDTKGNKTHNVYPAEPPAGVAIVVLSAGPDGVFDTDIASLELETVTLGDDIGFVLGQCSQTFN